MFGKANPPGPTFGTPVPVDTSGQNSGPGAALQGAPTLSETPHLSPNPGPQGTPVLPSNPGPESTPVLPVNPGPTGMPTTPC
jgi:hypothetical protein